MQNHRLWIVDGLLVGSVTLATSGLASWVKPEVGAAIAGGAISGGAITYVSYRRLNQKQFELDEAFERRLQNYKDGIEQHYKNELQALRVAFEQVLQELKQPPQQADDRTPSDQKPPENDKPKKSIPKPSPISKPSSEKPTPSPTPAVSKSTPKKPLELDPGLQQTENAIAWLNTHQVSVEAYTPPQSLVMEEALNQLSMQLGENYVSLAALHAQLKYHSVNGTRFRFYLKNRTQQDIQRNTAFAAKLNEASFLAYHRYSKEEKLIHLQPHQRSDFQRFIQGDWFERFIYAKVAQLLKERKLQYECLLNREVVFPNGDRYEIDQFYWVEGQPIWIECKAGKTFDNYLEQYSKMRELFGVPKSQAFMVVLNLPPHLAEIRTEAWGITVTDQDALLNEIDDRLDEIVRQKTTIADPLPEASTASPEQDPLKTVKLNPFPEHRQRTLSELIDLFNDPDYQPKSLNELKPLLKERLNESARKMNAVQLAFMKVGLFYDRSGRPIRSPNQPIARLRFLDVERLERRFVEKHAKEVLSVDATFFDQPENIERYEQHINGKAPDPETIERLKQDLTVA
jgi:hypothetical protein